MGIGIAKAEKRALSFKMREVGSWDHTQLAQDILKIDESLWFEEVSRQEKFRRTHVNTNTLVIMWHRESLGDNTVGKLNERNYNLLSFDNILKSLKPVYSNFFGDGIFLRVLITRLKPNTIIPMHTDGGRSLMAVNRTHLPLQLNEGTVFHVAGEDFHHELGKIYELNNAKQHGVTNDGDKYRINLIIDYLPFDK
tara:strand:- start:392 stop:976 length:585 start_codon:yes stop_codon:yes gene_type:complete